VTVTAFQDRTAQINMPEGHCFEFGGPRMYGFVHIYLCTNIMYTQNVSKDKECEVTYMNEYIFLYVRWMNIYTHTHTFNSTGPSSSTTDTHTHKHLHVHTSYGTASSCLALHIAPDTHTHTHTCTHTHTHTHTCTHAHTHPSPTNTHLPETAQYHSVWLL